MLLTVQGIPSYCYTGGLPFDPARPTLIFIHGAQNDHSVWTQQARSFAHLGYGVLAVDLPGHMRSQGAPKASVPEMAGWLLTLMDAVDVREAALIGHSMGSLIALEAAFQAPQRVTQLAMAGSAYPMKVADTLLASARDNELAAIDMVAGWSHSPLASHTTRNAARRLMQRMPGCLHTDLAACNSYANGELAAASVRCPTLLLLGASDMMTPPKSSKLLATAIPHAQTATLDSGHALMSEQPQGVLNALLDFIGSR
ncbi:alpha/beta hydrolase [Duganella sp. sic0402]|uniref:alpha/beta fold hydrolase n=1 Tax=Duganella sp. sic0402 TaxID=2854786 RepID=UPI001C44D94A|nr:alpha/beta hydrolase [Duganella sp. sic0402]MBV7534485.1 alpha/beta hydrolase [Duganella sp. sic0402]